MTAPPPQAQQPGMFAQMASTAAGVAVGSTIGHTMGHAITGMFSGGSSGSSGGNAELAPQPQAVNATAAPAQATAACEVDQRAFLRCLEQNDNDIGACQYYYDMMQQCLRQSSAASSSSSASSY